MENYTAKLSKDKSAVIVKMPKVEFTLSFEDAESLRSSLWNALEPVSKDDKSIRDLAGLLDKAAYRLQALSIRAGLAHVSVFSEIVFRIALALHHLLIPGTRCGVEAGITQPDAE